MLRAYMVKGWLGVVVTLRGRRIRVFTTGDEKFYLLDPLDRFDCSLCVQFPMRRKDFNQRLREGTLRRTV